MREKLRKMIITLIFLIFVWNGYLLIPFMQSHGNNNQPIIPLDIPKSANSEDYVPYSFLSTYFGGSAADQANAICVDSSGACYITGETKSLDFPTKNAFQSTHVGEGRVDGFVTKINPDLTIAYSTFLIGSEGTYLYGEESVSPHGIATDAEGACYVVGEINPDIIFSDVWIQKFNPDGTINFSRFSVEGVKSAAHGIAVDQKSGEFFICGYIGDGTGLDAFVRKYNPNGSVNFTNTFGGSSDDEMCNAIGIDKFGMCWVTGTTFSADFPIVNGVFPTFNGERDVFLARFNPDGSMNYSTFLGGGNTDFGYDLSLNSKGECIVTGKTISQNFPMLNAFDDVYGDEIPLYGETFVTKFNLDGSLNFSTFLGGLEGESGFGIELCEDGSCYCTGTTYSHDFPIENAYYSEVLGATDSYLTKLNPDGTLNFSTYLGGSDIDELHSISVLDDNICYLAGWTFSGDLHQINPIDSISGENDAWITKILNPLEDFDHDELTNLEEYFIKTAPNNSDTDGDGLTDKEELLGGTDPTNPDSDGDGRLDGKDARPNSFFYPTGIVLIVVGVFIGSVSALWIQIKPIYSIRKKNGMKKLVEIHAKINYSEYQDALDKLEEIKPDIEKVNDPELNRDWELIMNECEADLFYLEELKYPKLLIKEGKLQEARSKLIALLKQANKGDFANYLDKKIVSDITDLIKELSEQIG